MRGCMVLAKEQPNRARKRTNQMVDYQEGRPNNCPINVSFQAQVKMGPAKTNDSRYSSKNL